MNLADIEGKKSVVSVSTEELEDATTPKSLQSPQSLYLDAMDSFSSCTSVMEFEALQTTDAAISAAIAISCLVSQVVDTEVDPLELSTAIVKEIVEGAMGEKELCPVCYDELPLSLTEVTECNHRFCKCCLTKVRETKPMCPLCRHRIGEDPPRSFAAQYEDSILQLLAQLLSISHTLDRRRYVFARDTRHVLLDIFLGTRDENSSEDPTVTNNLILFDIDEEEAAGFRQLRRVPMMPTPSV